MSASNNACVQIATRVYLVNLLLQQNHFAKCDVCERSRWIGEVAWTKISRLNYEQCCMHVKLLEEWWIRGDQEVESLVPPFQQL